MKRKVEQCKVRTSLSLPDGAAPGLETYSPPEAPSEVTPHQDRCSQPACPALCKQTGPSRSKNREIPQAQGRRVVKDSKLLQRGGSRG